MIIIIITGVYRICLRRKSGNSSHSEVHYSSINLLNIKMEIHLYIAITK